MIFDVPTVMNLLDIEESYKAPGRLMEILMDKNHREAVFKKFLEKSTDVSYDWFQEYFESEQAERKSKKQDFTPNSVSMILNKLVKPNGQYYEVAAGTGGILINRWWADCLAENPIMYMPHEHLYWVEELSDRAIPFLLFNCAIRGMNAVVYHGDTLNRIARGIFVVENTKDDFLQFSDINIMPYNDEVKQFFGVEHWIDNKYPEHIETDGDKWASNVINHSKLFGKNTI